MERFKGEVFYSVIKGKLTARAEFYDEREGKRRQVWRTVTSTKKEAKERVITAVEKILNDDRKAPHDYTFAEYAEYYKQNHAVPAKFIEGVKVKGKKTWKTIRCDIDRLTEFFGKKKLRDIKHDHILKFREKRLDTPVRITYFEKVLITDEERESLKVNVRKKYKRVKKEKVSQRAIASVNHELRTLRSMFTTAKRNGWITEIPEMSGVVLTALESRREKMPTPEEFERLLAEASKEPKRRHLPALMLLVSEVGARPIEAFQLKWEKRGEYDSFVDLIDRTVTLVSDKGKKRRVDKLFMTDKLYLELMRLPKINEYVLGGIKSAKRAWNSIKAKTGIDVDLYSLRHVYASRVDALVQSESLKMRLTRHTQPKTADRYRHFTDETFKAVADELSRTPYEGEE